MGSPGSTHINDATQLSPAAVFKQRVMGGPHMLPACLSRLRLPLKGQAQSQAGACQKEARAQADESGVEQGLEVRESLLPLQCLDPSVSSLPPYSLRSHSVWDRLS